MAPISNPSSRKAEAGGSGVLSRSPIPREFKASLGYMKPWEGGEGRQGGGGRGGKKEEEGRERRKEREKEGRRTGKGRERGKGTLESTDWANFLENTKGSSIKGWANEKVKTSWDAYRCHESSGRGGGGGAGVCWKPSSGSRRPAAWPLPSQLRSQIKSQTPVFRRYLNSRVAESPPNAARSEPHWSPYSLPPAGILTEPSSF